MRTRIRIFSTAERRREFLEGEINSINNCMADHQQITRVEKMNRVPEKMFPWGKINDDLICWIILRED